MYKGICVLIIAIFVTIPAVEVSAQIKANRYTEEDNTPMLDRAKILPMNNYNFLKEDYRPNGTKAYIDTLSIDHHSYIVFSFGTQKKGESDYKSFFSLLIKMRDNEDFMDLAKKNCLYSNVTSRNHPDYIGQGVLKREEYSIDFVAFKRLNSSNAIINNKIFDLSKGTLILLTEDPQYKFLLMDRQLDFEEVPIGSLKKQLNKILKNAVTQKGIK